MRLKGLKLPSGGSTLMRNTIGICSERHCRPTLQHARGEEFWERMIFHCGTVAKWQELSCERMPSCWIVIFNCKLTRHGPQASKEFASCARSITWPLVVLFGGGFSEEIGPTEIDEVLALLHVATLLLGPTVPFVAARKPCKSAPLVIPESSNVPARWHLAEIHKTWKSLGSIIGPVICKGIIVCNHLRPEIICGDVRVIANNLQKHGHLVRMTREC